MMVMSTPMMVMEMMIFKFIGRRCQNGRGCEENGNKASVDKLMVMVMKTITIMMMILMSMMVMMMIMVIMMIMERASEQDASQRTGWKTSLLLGCAMDPWPEKQKGQTTHGADQNCLFLQHMDETWLREHR